MPDISQGAQQLYDYMLHHRQIRFHDSEKGHKIQFTYKGDPEFVGNYVVYLDELHKAKWLQKHSIPNTFVLGYGSITPHFFGHPAPVEDRIQIFLESYSDPDRVVIESTLESFGHRRRSDTLTPLQIVKELEYYNRFSPATVIEGCRIYLSLDSRQQHGENYARGIIRNEASKSDEKSTSPSVSHSTRTRSEPSSLHKVKVERAKFVRDHIDLSLYSEMTPEQQSEHIRVLEMKFDEQRAISTS